ncbi:MAG: leucine-rich repeat domain-containing protein [Candidatus Helarchaeota archaeon]
MGKKYSNLVPNQAKILEEIDNSIDKEIKRRKKLKWDENGYTADNQGNVIELNLNFSNLKTLPESIGNLQVLRILFLNNNDLTKLPESIGNLRSLQTLALGENKLIELPKSIGKLGALRELILNNNRLTTLPNSFGDLISLEELNLEHNRLKSLPESFGKLKSLQILDFSHNQLPTLPKSFGKLKSLQILELDYNKLEWLPESFGNLKSLEKLNLNHNQLIALPGFFDGLKSLQTLNVQKNKLTNLPGYLWRLNLYDLRISGNPLKHDWDKIKRKGTKEILDFCRQVGSVNLFVSYSFADYEEGIYHIPEIVENLKGREDISYAYHCIEDMKKDGQIDKFMNETIPHCQFILFFATKRSLRSPDCIHELTLGNTHSVKIIPVLGEDVTWDHPNIKKMGLTREFGIEFKMFNDYEKFCDEVYDYIQQYKRKHRVFTKEEATLSEELTNIKYAIVNYLESQEFQKVLKRKMPDFKQLFQRLSVYKITPKTFFLKCAELVSPSKPQVKTKAKAVKTPVKKLVKKPVPKKALKKTTKKSPPSKTTSKHQTTKKDAIDKKDKEGRKDKKDKTDRQER